ncbi:Sodium channel protein type 11 subunit alpha (NaN) (Sensory neuron sodium channel 2) (Sodium channel protein type XI subunit alpha) (Voltage-gated sodium channel subunit alpha Nav1.9) [Durusdinium trenchii]|uniref:Sodium channel protein type 11 subunit alpha (NaN) (Sensory neuron sodium channel 2) (Sodium channel protein type XI subunit alpha) (Voltage-gated sodium channel subunit alpha Nav1.9) n=1 Tax=Durusdinium trenchii TaxID=1381693 RepID=A0ABP0LX48_9DINO
MDVIEEEHFFHLVEKMCAAHKQEVQLLRDQIRYLHTPEGQKLFRDHHSLHDQHKHGDHGDHGHENHGHAAHGVSGGMMQNESLALEAEANKDCEEVHHHHHHHHHEHRTPWHSMHVKTFHNSQSTSELSKGWCTKLKACLKHPAFDITMSAIIVMNAVMFAFEAQYKGFELAHQLDLTEDSALLLWPGAMEVFEVAELIFGIIFTAEVALKIFVEHLRFFREGWNWLDFIVVFVWLFGKTGQSLPVNSQILRLGRLFRLLRMLRLVRQMKEFDALFLMTTAIRSSFMVLGWTIILLFVCQMLCALVIQQTLFGFYFDPKHEASFQDQQDVFVYFGTFTRSLLSLFEMTLANWPPVARLLMEHVTEFWMPVCLFHKLTMGFAVVGVINGVLMQETFKVAHMDDTVMVREKQRAMRAHLAKMSLLFQEADTSGDGRLDLEEFKSILDDYEVKIWLAAMDLDVSDVEELFFMLDDGGDGRLSAEELVKGVAKLRGAARAMDLRKIHRLSSDLQEGLTAMAKSQEAKDLKKLLQRKEDTISV